MKTKVHHIIHEIEDMVQLKVLKIGDKIPSLTDIQNKYDVSRDTANRAYRDLLQRDIIQAQKGKGYFVSSGNRLSMNIFLLLDELSEYKNTMVKAIEESLTQDNDYKLYFHHYNEEVFQNLIEQNLGKFTHYLISPFPGSDKIKRVIDEIPPHQLVLIDRHDGQSSNIRFVGQEFEKDILSCLVDLKNEIGKYEKLTFVFPELSNHPKELKKGFREFCNKVSIPFSIVSSSAEIQLNTNSLYLVINDDDLAHIVLQAKKLTLTVGQDIGIISYNETCLKSVVANGITTISADFKEMGKSIVSFIKDETLDKSLHIPAKIIKRNSI